MRCIHFFFQNDYIKGNFSFLNSRRAVDLLCLCLPLIYRHPCYKVKYVLLVSYPICLLLNIVICVTNKVPFKVSPVLANDFSYLIHHSGVLRQQHALFFKGHSLFSWSLWNPKSINLLSRSPFTDISQKIEKYSEGGGGPTYLTFDYIRKEKICHFFKYPIVSAVTGWAPRVEDLDRGRQFG